MSDVKGIVSCYWSASIRASSHLLLNEKLNDNRYKDIVEDARERDREKPTTAIRNHNSGFVQN